MMNDAVSAAGMLLTLCLVLLCAYGCSRFLGKGFRRASSGRNMKVIEQLRLGADQQLLLIKLGEHTYLIGVTQSSIRLIAEVEGDFEEQALPKAASGLSPLFEETLKKRWALRRKDKEKTDE